MECGIAWKATDRSGVSPKRSLRVSERLAYPRDAFSDMSFREKDLQVPT